MFLSRAWREPEAARASPWPAWALVGGPLGFLAWRRCPGGGCAEMRRERMRMERAGEREVAGQPSRVAACTWGASRSSPSTNAVLPCSACGRGKAPGRSPATWAWLTRPSTAWPGKSYLAGSGAAGVRTIPRTASPHVTTWQHDDRRSLSMSRVEERRPLPQAH